MTEDLKAKILEAEKRYPEGIYFNMSEAEYHSLPFFSRSFAEEVLCDLEEAKHRLTNPIEQTEAMNLGTAIHSAILEPEIFDELYVRYPNFDDFSGKKILKGCDDLAEYLASVGEKKTGKKEELIARAKPFLDPEKFVIWDEMIADFMEDVKTHGKRIINNEDFQTLAGIRASLSKRPAVKEIFSKGFAEVTLIWRDEETGIMCKCRLDYLRPEAIADVKTFSLKSKGKPLYEIMCREIINNKYNLQFVIYHQALEAVIKKIRGNKAKAYGEVSKEWMDKFLEHSTKQFFIAFVRTAAPYQIKAIELEKGVAGAGANAYYQVANDIWRLTLNKFKRALDSGDWSEKEVETLDDVHVPSVMYQAPIY